MKRKRVSPFLHVGGQASLSIGLSLGLERLKRGARRGHGVEAIDVGSPIGKIGVFVDVVVG